MSYEAWKWLHVLSGSLLLGGGFGSAFHLILASHGRDTGEVAAAAHRILRFDGSVGVATALFQLVGGLLLARELGLSWTGGWVGTSLLLYALALFLWVPVIALEWKMRDIARNALRGSGGLPRNYWTAFFTWLGLGACGFLLLACVLWLMLHKRLPFAGWSEAVRWTGPPGNAIMVAAPGCTRRAETTPANLIRFMPA